jgi:hypothetical protein
MTGRGDRLHEERRGAVDDRRVAVPRRNRNRLELRSTASGAASSGSAAQDDVAVPENMVRGGGARGGRLRPRATFSDANWW